MRSLGSLPPSGVPSLGRKPCKAVFLGQSVLRLIAEPTHPPAPALAVPTSQCAAQKSKVKRQKTKDKSQKPKSGMSCIRSQLFIRLCTIN